MGRRKLRMAEGSLVVGAACLLILHYYFDVSLREVAEWTLKSIFAGTVIVVVVDAVRRLARRIDIPFIRL